VAKAEWGLKRVCVSCSTRYYDMRHDPIVCPKCGATFDAEAIVKTKRVRAPAVAAEPVIGPIVAEDIDTELVAAMENVDIGAGSPAIQGEGEAAVVAEEVVDDVEDDADPAVEGEAEAEAEEEEVLEDASELGEDEDDMAEVIENVDEEEER
jgi:uncharacterized protein (TIGR02300 family)